MKPTSLSLRNCRTYESLDLDLPEGAIAILGSNGAGKTTLVSAIDVALFGPESRTLAEWLSEDNPDGTLSITLTFEHEDGIYRARRTYSGKGRGQSRFDLERLIESRTENGHGLTVSEAVSQTWQPLTVESQASTQDLLESELGLTRETFHASSFIAAGAMFCDLQPREQKRILGDLLELGQWDDWLERARREKRTCENGLIEVEALLARAEVDLAERSLIEAERAEAAERAKGAQALLDAALSRLASAREALTEAGRKAESRAGAEKAVQQAEHYLSELHRGIEAREESLRALDARLATRPGLEIDSNSLPALEAEREALRQAIGQWDERQRLEREHAALMAEAESLRAKVVVLHERRMTVLAGVGSATCDRCGQTLHEEAAKRAAQSFADEADELSFKANNIEEHDLVTLNEKISALPAEPPDAERWNTIDGEIARAQNARAQLAALEEAQARRDQAQDELSRMRAGLPEREAVVAAARADLEALGPHDPQAIMAAQHLFEKAEREEQTWRFDLGERQKAIARADERLALLEKIAAEATGARERRDALHADLDLYTRLERACGPNGVPALILEQIAIPQLEASADEILQRFGSKALGVQLLTQREKKTGGLADTLQVNVLTEHGSRDYRTFSTGERLRINAAITLAIAKFVAGRSAQTGLLVIDDLGPLDAQGMAVLADICRELQETVTRVYVISQSPDLRDAFEQSLEVVSENGRSRVVGTGGENLSVLEGAAV